MGEEKYREYKIYGLVQGVGFRPFVARIADDLNICGDVRNDGGIVTVRISATDDTAEEFLRRIYACDLPRARVDGIDEISRDESNQYTDRANDTNNDINHGNTTLDKHNNKENDKFVIIKSSVSDDRIRILPPDEAICPECERELYDSSNRRYRHPFISCVSCGPRYTILESVPYDRENTVMRHFSLCHECETEYIRRGDCREYAQTICCNSCGPKLYSSVSPKKSPEKDLVRVDSVSHKRVSMKNSDEVYICEAVDILRSGGIVAIKDNGGYHFACDAFNEEAVSRLREFKHRDAKPFAVMFRTVDEIRKYAEVSEAEEKLLTSSVRPIVLLEQIAGHVSVIDRDIPAHERDIFGDIASDSEKVVFRDIPEYVTSICSTIPHSVLGASNRIGAMLPCNPLQMLILDEVSPLVMTSGNRGGEPICIDDDVMRSYLGKGIDYVLSHDRQIVCGLDDSIYQVVRMPIGDGKNISVNKSETRNKGEIVQILRRARGLVPLPIDMGRKLHADTFAAGGDLKAVFAFGQENYAYLSGHFGDLDDIRAQDARLKEIGRMSGLLNISPSEFVTDEHLTYVTVQNYLKDIRAAVTGMPGSKDENTDKEVMAPNYYNSLRNIDSVRKIQHHEAHIASVMAEHHLSEPLLGLAFDGTGYGQDGSIWGGEFLYWDGHVFNRVGHLETVRLVGGDESARNAAQTAYLYAHEAKNRRFLDDAVCDAISIPDSMGVGKDRADNIRIAWEKKISTYDTSSMGRLFDAVSSLLGICHYNSYEGECAMRLQAAAELAKMDMISSLHIDTSDFVKVDTKGIYILDGVQIFSYIAKQKKAGEKSAGELALLFHYLIAISCVKMCEMITAKNRIPILLSGGTMQNALFLKLLVSTLAEKGFLVYLNEQVPCGDGGLALGQLYLKTLL